MAGILIQPLAAQTVVSVPDGANLDNYTPVAGDTWNLLGNAFLSNGVLPDYGKALPSELTINGTSGGSIITLNDGAGHYGSFVNHLAAAQTTLNLNDVTLTDGNSSNGGAIGISNNLVINGNAEFTNNRANGVGGAVNANNFTFSGAVLFQGNTGAFAGGAVFAASNFSLTAAGPSTFVNNIAGGNGGAIWAGENVTLNAAGGDITFSGNKDGGSIANAIYLANIFNSGASTTTFNAHAGRTITFLDPITNNSANGLVSVNKTGDGVVSFDGANYSNAADLWSEIYANTTVQAGTFEIANNAVYGALAADSVTPPAGTSFTSAAGSLVQGGVAGTIRADNVTLNGDLSIAGRQPGTRGVFNINSNNLTLGGGSILFNTNLNDGVVQDTDLLVLDLNGSATTGQASVMVTNIGGSGALTVGDGIKLVQANSGTTAGAFALVGDYTTADNQQAVVGGAYAYTLHYGGVVAGTTDNDWYLRSELIPGPTPPPRFQAGVPLYEVYPQHLLALITAPTLQQRVGNRYWIEPTPVTGEAGGSGALIEEQAVWARIEGSHSSIEPAVTTSGADYDTNVWRGQAGLDGLLHEAADGSRLIGGITVHWGHASSDVTSFLGDGDIDTTGYGFGGTLTWYDQSGLYVDGQANLTWFDTDVTSNASGLATPTLADGNGGFGYTLSVETGKKIDLNDSWTVTPQAQLVYANVDFDRFQDAFGANISLGSGDSLLGRLGISADRDQSWTGEDGKTMRSHLYGIANLYYQFLDATKVDVSGASFESRPEKLWGGLGLGGSYNWNDDKYSLYGEVSINSSLKNFGDSYALTGTAGFKVKW